jgi:hypothetical protein
MHGACVVIDNAYTVLRIQGNGHNHMGGTITNTLRIQPPTRKKPKGWHTKNSVTGN